MTDAHFAETPYREYVPTRVPYGALYVVPHLAAHAAYAWAGGSAESARPVALYEAHSLSRPDCHLTASNKVVLSTVRTLTTPHPAPAKESKALPPP